MKLIKTTFFSGIITIIRITSGFVANKVVASYTGTAGIAVIGSFVNFINIVLTFANGGISAGVVKYTAEFEADEPKLKSLFSTSLKISLFCSGIVGIVLLILANFFSKLIFLSNIYSNQIRILGITIFLYALNVLFLSILNGKKQIKTYTIVNTVGSIVGLLVTVLLVYFFKLDGALYALVLSQSIIFFITLFFVMKSSWFSMDYFYQRLDHEIVKKLGQYTLMAIVSALTVPVSQLVLRNMIIETKGINDAGLWQGMMRISDGYLMLMTTALATYYLPKLSSLKITSEIRTEILNGYKVILPTVFASCAIIFFFRFTIIDLLYTKDFRSMSDLFFFQLLGDFFKMGSWILAYLMLAKSMTKIFIITEIVFSGLYVVLGYVCVNYFGIEGIAIAFAINYLLYWLLMTTIFIKTILHHD